MWAIAYRCNPIEDVHILPFHGGVQGSQYSGGKPDSKLLIDATMKTAMPPLALPKKEFMERAQELWAQFGLPPITVKAPWHGHSLGRLDRPVGDVWAARAAAGRWEETGRETLARQRTGLKPETPGGRQRTELGGRANFVDPGDCGVATISPPCCCLIARWLANRGRLKGVGPT